MVLIVGDYTARVGDPSGRSATRPVLSGEEIDANARTYQEQAFHVLLDDPELLEVRFNSEWLDMRMEELFRLARTTTVAQLLERDDFAKRWAAQAPISILELLYPLMQGYDSVAVRSDVELGGTDQTFNLLLARDVQRAYGQPEQCVLTMPILPGRRRRGEDVEVAWATTSASPRRRARCTGARCRCPTRRWTRGSRCSRSSARRPAPRRATPSTRSRGRWWSASTAPRRRGGRAASSTRVHVQRAAPEEIEELALAAVNGTVHLPAAIAEGFGMSRSEARRMLAQGGVQARRRAAGGRGARPAARAPRRRGAAGRQAPLPPPAGELRAGRRWPSTRACCAWRPPATARSSTSPRACARSSSARACSRAWRASSRSAPRSPITTIEYEPGAVADLQALLDRLIAPEGEYRHNALNHDTNAHSHLRAALIGPSETIPVVGGELGLGTWQQVVLLDFDDRPRERIVSVQVLS